MTRFAIGAALLALAACETAPVRRGPLGNDIFEDVPAPKTAVYRHAKNESFAYNARTFRCGRFVFEYQGKAADAAAFFRRTMVQPPYSWTLTAEDSAGAGSYNLVFEKNDDRCTVDVDRVPKADIGKTRNVNILVRVNYRN